MNKQKVRKVPKFPNSVPVNRDLLRGIKNLTAVVGGEKISLSVNDVVIYSYIWYRKSFHNVYFETQETIANETGLSEKSVLRLISKLDSLELIHIKKKSVDRFKRSNQYTWLASPQQLLKRFDAQPTATQELPEIDDGQEAPDNVVPIKAPEKASVIATFAPKSAPDEVEDQPQYSPEDLGFLQDRYREYKQIVNKYNDDNNLWEGEDDDYQNPVTFKDFTPEIFGAALELDDLA